MRHEAAVDFVTPRLNVTRGERRVWTAAWSFFSRAWPNPPSVPLQQRWDLVGLGLCPATGGRRSRGRRRLRATSLIACLQHCEVHEFCKSLSFSQQREECILRREQCRESDLTWHVSYVTLAPTQSARFLAEGLEQMVLAREEDDGPDQAVQVFASTSPRMRPMWDIFFESLHLAGDDVALFVHNSTDGDTSTNKTPSRRRPWPSSYEDHVAMRRRDHQKVGLLVRAVWTSFRSGRRFAVVSDVDVQVFPGWSAVVKACTSRAHVCLMQSPGVYATRRQPFNSGFLAFAVDEVSLSFVLRLASAYEEDFLHTDPKMAKLEQEVLNDFLVDHGHGLWAMFNPELMSIFVSVLPMQVLKVKVHHSCGSAAGSRLTGLYNAKRLYYSLLPLCLSERVSGPQHPCCVLHGFRRGDFSAEFLTLPPFVRGAVYGPVQVSMHGEMDALHRTGELETLEFWLSHCSDLRYQLLGAWTKANPKPEKKPELGWWW